LKNNVIPKQRYQAGDWFAVPLPDGGFGLGLVARKSRGLAVLGYFFGPRRQELPTESDVEPLGPGDAVLVQQISGLALKSGDWPVIARSQPWQPSRWPMPAFSHIDVVDRTIAYRREYDEKDLDRMIAQTLITPEEAKRYPRDGIGGSIAVQKQLSRLL
jgi:hypothetical protein